MNTASQTVKKSLICTLSDEERRNYGIELASTLESIEEVEDEKKKTADRYKDRIAGLQRKANDIRQKVSSGQEWRDVECSVIFNEPIEGRKQIVRDDIGEVVATEWMTESEKQFTLPLDEDKPADEGALEVEAEVINEGADEPEPVMIADEASRPGPIAEATAAGRQAFVDGKTIDKPPYAKKRIKEIHAWCQGWIAAQDEADAKADDEHTAAAEPMPAEDPEAPTTEAGEAGDY